MFHTSFGAAESRWLAYEPDPAERLQEVGIYRFGPDRSDRHLERAQVLEETRRR
jgi:hypothetical protein